MAVEVHRNADLAVPEDFHNHPRVDALRQQQRCAGVSKIVETHPGQVCLGKQGLKPMRDSRTILRRAYRSGERKSCVLPPRAGELTLFVITAAMPEQRC